MYLARGHLEVLLRFLLSTYDLLCGSTLSLLGMLVLLMLELCCDVDIWLSRDCGDLLGRKKGWKHVMVQEEAFYEISLLLQIQFFE